MKSSSSIPNIHSSPSITSHLNSSPASKHKDLNQTNGLPTPAELALLQNDQMTLERAKYLSLFSNLPGSANTNPLATNPLLTTAQSFAANAALHSRLPQPSNLLQPQPNSLNTPGLMSNINQGFNPNVTAEMQANADAMKYFLPGVPQNSLNPLASLHQTLNPSSALTQNIPGLTQPMLAMPHDLSLQRLTDFTRSGFGEREQLFSRYSILSNAGGGVNLADKLQKATTN